VRPPTTNVRLDRVASVLVPLALLALAAALAFGPWQFVSPVPAATMVPTWATDPTPVRQPSPRPEVQIGGYTFRCSDCHNLFRSPPETTRQLTQHSHVVLKHGINTRCFNCHHIANRDAFIDDWGQEIPWNEPPRLCAKCHGPVYRDWLHGSHGRSNGYWDTSRGPQERPKCIECHDPHQPPFPPMQPAAPPNTLRMGDQRAGTVHVGVGDPLRVYQQDGASDAREDTQADGSRGGIGGAAQPERATKPQAEPEDQP